MFGETSLLFVYFEACHYNSSFPTKMSLNTYGHSLGPAAGVYEDVYFITPVTDTRALHIIFFLLFSLSPSRRAAAARRQQHVAEQQQQHAAGEQPTSGMSSPWPGELPMATGAELAMVAGAELTGAVCVAPHGRKGRACPRQCCARHGRQDRARLRLGHSG